MYTLPRRVAAATTLGLIFLSPMLAAYIRKAVVPGRMKTERTSTGGLI
jgi:hypothetical protein